MLNIILPKHHAVCQLSDITSRNLKGQYCKLVNTIDRQQH
jgi:hypothetical protein